MKYQTFRAALIAAMGVAGLILQSADASEPAVQPAGGEHTTMQWKDLSLGAGGLFHGRVMDASGVAVPAAQVTILKMNHELAVTTSGPDGAFAFQGVGGGLYQVVVKGPDGKTSHGLYRAWSPGTAPPSSIASALFVQQQNIQRGQWCPAPGNYMTRPWIAAALITTAGVLPIAINNSGS
jgi:hypothetical protein